MKLITTWAGIMQRGEAVHRLGRNWRMEGRLQELERNIEEQRAISFMHVLRKANKLANNLANNGVDMKREFKSIEWREEERFIIQASAFETPCRCEAEACHILHRHAETTHQPGLFCALKDVLVQGIIVVVVYLVSSAKKVIRSLRSFSFLRPANAILVPGMYFFGFSR